MEILTPFPRAKRFGSPAIETGRRVQPRIILFMCNRLIKPLGLFSYCAALILFALGIWQLPAQIIQPSGNSLSYLWDLKYGASGLSADADTDGDGVSNSLESF